MSATARSGLGAWTTREMRGLRHPTSSPVLPALSLALAVIYAIAIVRSGGDVLLLFPLIAALVVLAVLAHPAVGLYVLFGSAILFEQFLVPGLSPVTQYSRVFQNLSAYTPIPIRLSVIDLLMILTLAGIAAQRFRAGHRPLRISVLGWAVLAYF